MTPLDRRRFLGALSASLIVTPSAFAAPSPEQFRQRLGKPSRTAG